MLQFWYNSYHQDTFEISFWSLCHAISLFHIFDSNVSKNSQVGHIKVPKTFVLVGLFSYQQIVIGSFTLIKCIDIGNMKVLHVQGDIQCFTQWQTVTEIFIYLNIIPFFFVVSHVPYYVRKKEMSVQMFILICLFPVPGLVIYHLLSIYNKRKIIPNAKVSD